MGGLQVLLTYPHTNFKKTVCSTNFNKDLVDLVGHWVLKDQTRAIIIATHNKQNSILKSLLWRDKRIVLRTLNKQAKISSRIINAINSLDYVIHQTVDRTLQNEFKDNHWNCLKSKQKLYTSWLLFEILFGTIDV